MSLIDDFERGIANRRTVLGDAWVDQATVRADEFTADFQSLITRYAWHEIWGRPGLDHTTRRLLVLGMTMGLARWEEFELHCAAAIRGGVPMEKIRETLMQGAIYCGVPAANTAFKIADEQLRANGQAPSPKPLTPAARVSFHHTFSRPQLRVAVQGADEGMPVVLSHALGLDLTMWDTLATQLATTRPVLRYDHRGHGGSATPPAPWSMDDLVDDAARVIREWGRGPVAFIGLSMGGMVGQGLAIRHPELVRALVLANTTSHYPVAAQAAWTQRIEIVQSEGMEGIADMVVERYLHADFRDDYPARAEALREQVLRNQPSGYVAACHAVRAVDWQSRLGEIRCPTLVIAGRRDTGAPPEMAEAIARAVPGATLRVFDDASHLSVVEQPHQFRQAVDLFLGGLR